MKYLDTNGVNRILNRVVKYKDESVYNPKNFKKIENASIDVLFGLTPKILRLVLNNKVTRINMSKCLKSWGEIYFNGVKVNEIPTQTSGILEIHNAVALDIYSWNNSCNFANGFYAPNNVGGITSISGSLDTSRTTDMTSMFGVCYALTSADISEFNVSNVANATDLFTYCTNLYSVKLPKNFTSKLKYMTNMFEKCNSVDNLDLSGINTSGVVDMSNLFQNCNALTNLNIDGWSTTNVNSMNRMFYGCFKLKNLDLRHFDVTNLQDMTYMFGGTFEVNTIDMSTWVTSNLSLMTDAFCSSGVVTIKMNNWVTTKVTNIDALFHGTESVKDIYLDGEDVTIETVYLISDQANVNNQMQNVYVYSADKQSGLDYFYNIKYIYPI